MPVRPGAPGGSQITVRWYRDRIRRITTTGPLWAHRKAAAETAGLGARMIKSTYTGKLARDISRPKPLGEMRTAVGSNLPYAAIENWGGKIMPKNAKYLYIRGRRVGAGGQGTRSTYGGPITATVGPDRGRGYVEHRGKHFLEAMTVAFPRLFIVHLRTAFGRR